MNKIILGIDPGTATTGFGLVEVDEHGNTKYITCGHIATSKDVPAAERLVTIKNSLLKLLKQYKPEVVAVEKLFFAKNITTAISVAEARGVILASCVEHNTEIIEYTPLQVKQGLTGYGKADKGQVQRMVKTILNLEDIPKPDDAADALAIAIRAASETAHQVVK
ncbi:MAG: crossover junction endodeoxyribonuclease RuvC [Patescibacteria group bacterium]|nr:crossover junction endodeoxyribonuclease RuvC [Patescibacteria group bacterium]